MFQKVSDKFHRKQQSSASNKSNPSSPSASSKTVPISSQPSTPSAPAPLAPAVDAKSAHTPMEGIEGGSIPENQTPVSESRTMSIQMTDAAAAQANLQMAAQQARVAAINAAATQAALETVSITPQDNPTPTPAQPAQRKTAGRYALNDFYIERTSKHNGRFYAVKVLNKEKVIKMKQVEHTNSEREMLVRVRHPFLVNLWGTFQDVNNLYMVMDFVAGGELFSLLRKSQRFPNSVAKFYAAEVALALDYLHSLDIIYRDLKPENLLLGADGHVKVTDFGFAKHVPDITWTLCGTPDYRYNKSVDWYALGVLIFEMLAGYPPFFTEDGNPMKLYEKNLLVGDLTKRYGNLRAGSSDIFAHGWFAEVDWDKLYRREIPAPYVPKIEGEGDASQFDRYQEADVSAYGKAGTGPYDHFFTDF
ncbi:uncharacterized protein L201_004094 [Kwoniella dendrophila CBS 6074]|uniref:cAMP-dependent protein kinase n=1 Tax=Kwoniella dendrophila CBS 6074 TaxID=1295534 RepID=A0AAX4JUR2_9TREE